MVQPTLILVLIADNVFSTVVEMKGLEMGRDVPHFAVPGISVGDVWQCQEFNAGLSYTHNPVPIL